MRSRRIHDSRHTRATLALHAGKNIRWVANQSGHVNPAFTLRTYARALLEEGSHLSVADFGGPGWPSRAQSGEIDFHESRDCADSMPCRERFEATTLRFETWRRREKSHLLTAAALREATESGTEWHL